jgi:hypothetical protein
MLWMIAVILWTSTQVPAAQAAMHPHVRERWLLGLGIGGGMLQTSGGGLYQDRETGAAASFRAGYAFSSQVSLEMDGTLWYRDESGTDFMFNVTGATINYYPRAMGLVLRAGVGSGSGEASQQQGNVTVSSSESGLGILGGVGYEFRVTPRFAFGPQIQYSWVDLDSFDSDWFNFELAACWYFIKR